MIDLDDKETLRSLDPQNTLETTDSLVKQCQVAWSESNKVVPTHSFSDIRNIVFCGMGASIYGALVLKALEASSLSFPTEVVSDYHLPPYVNHQTLVVLTSYSGTTEEVLSCAQEAKNKKAKMLVLTSGGELAEFAKSSNITAYIFDGKLNLSKTPRLGAGYTILGLIGLFNASKVLSAEEAVIENALDRALLQMDDIKKAAYNDYEKYIDAIPIIFAAEHLSGNAQILRNQFNETSKTFSSHFIIPDLNHHLMEGLQFPKDSNLKFLSFFSRNYSPKLQKRVLLTNEVVKQNNRDLIVYETSGASFYDDFLEVLIYGGYLTLFLALNYKQNPSVNPWVD